MNIPPVDMIVAPGCRATNVNANMQRGRQRVQAMAGQGHGRNQGLQGADPALVQILQKMMQNRDANHDNSRKQFLMFPKESFTGEEFTGLSFPNILIIKINKVPSPASRLICLK